MRGEVSVMSNVYINFTETCFLFKLVPVYNVSCGTNHHFVTPVRTFSVSDDRKNRMLKRALKINYVF